MVAADDVGNDGAGSPLLGVLKEERALLLTRWQCLLEEKRQLTAMMRVAAAGERTNTNAARRAVSHMAVWHLPHNQGCKFD